METTPFHLSSKGKAEFPKKLGPQGWDAFPFATKTFKPSLPYPHENSWDLLDRLWAFSPGHGCSRRAAHADGGRHVRSFARARCESVRVDGPLPLALCVLRAISFCLWNPRLAWRLCAAA